MGMAYDLGIRKVQESHGTYYVSLPMSWIKNYRLKKGDLLRIRVRGNGALEIRLKRKW